MPVESTKKQKPTTSGSLNKPFTPVELASKYGRSGSQLDSPFLEATAGQLSQAKHKLQVLKMLVEKMSTSMPDSISSRVAALWRVLKHAHMHNTLPLSLLLSVPPSLTQSFHPLLSPSLTYYFENTFTTTWIFIQGFVALYTTMTSWNPSPTEIDRFQTSNCWYNCHVQHAKILTLQWFLPLQGKQMGL